MSSKYDNVLDLISRDETVRFLQDILRIDSVIRVPSKRKWLFLLLII